MLEYEKLEKDQSIIDILRYLENNLDLRHVVISDYWEIDLCAIGLKKKDKLIYLAVDNTHKNITVKYDYDFEILDAKDVENINVIKKKRSVNRATLLQDLKKFWDI